MSASGVFFTTPLPLSPGARITFSIELEHADPSGVLPITCEGQIVRIEPRPDAIGVAVHISAFDLGWGQISAAIR